MKEVVEILMPILFQGTIQLTIFGGLLILQARWFHDSLPPATVCGLILFVFSLSTFPEGVFLDLLPKNELVETPAFEVTGAANPVTVPALRNLLFRTGATMEPHYPIGFRIWLTGFLILSGLLLWRTVRAHREIIRIPMLIQPSLLETLERCKKRLGVWVPVTIYRSAATSSPMLYGWLHPRIIFPESSTTASSAENDQFILAHECMHIRRKDILWQWILTGFVIVFWFHPFSWILLRHYKVNRELACDKSVIKKFSFPPELYAAALISELRNAKRKDTCFLAPIQAGIVEKTSHFETRIQQIMNPKKSNQYSLLITALSIGVAILTSGLIIQAKAAPAPGLTEPEISEIKKQSEKILAAIWNKDKPAAGYEYASSYYKSNLTVAQYEAAMTSPQITSITIASRKLVELTELTGEQAVEGGKNVHLIYQTEIEGASMKFNENLFLINEDGKWLMTGHWIKP